jgi:1,4-dihydroxy-2-naphthoate octaprenyltransferase
LATVGLVLTHISVNTLNDYFDYKTGVDLATKRTPFSGGSGMLPAGLLSPAQVFWLGMGAFLLAVPVGVYFVIVSGWPLLPLLLVAAVCVLFYTPHIMRTPWPEWSAGLGLGLLPVVGAYFVQTESYTFSAFMAAVPSGILVHNLLLLNEFPDLEADRQGGKRTIPVALGMGKAGIIYSALTIAVYAWIVGCVIGRVMPVYTLIALATLPIAIKAIQGAIGYKEEGKLPAALGQNVMVILVTQLLIGLGYVLAAVF